MIELTGKQKRFLRGRGQTLRAAVALPEAGLSEAGLPEAIIRTVAEHLRRDELVKVRLPAGASAQRKALAARLADAAGAACVGVVGRTTLLYRPADEARRDKPLALP